jgi:hypothetical protein
VITNQIANEIMKGAQERTEQKVAGEAKYSMNIEGNLA